MYNFDDINTYNLSSNLILSNISEYDIFRFYCKNFYEVGKVFCSELRKDRSPSCNIYNSSRGLRYKDFGTDEHYNCFEYVMIKYGCTFYESLNIIANDFKILNKSNIWNFQPLIGDSIPNNKESVYKRIKTKIQVVSQPFTIIDYEYWDKYHIPLTLLQEYNICSAKYLYINKLNKSIFIEYRKDNPIYAYKFENSDKVSYKVYQPLNTNKKYKWLFNGTKDDIEGFDQLNLYGDLLIITKSMKDVLVYRLFGYDAISLQGEANKLEVSTLDKLKKRFNTILVNYDNDEQGIKSANKLYKMYNLKTFIIPLESECKDISDYICKYGKIKAKKLIKKLINENIKN